MAYRPVLEFPNDFLRTVSSDVTVFDEKLAALVTDLQDTINVVGGVGLAAPQLGVAQRVIWVATPDFTEPMINPKILEWDGPCSVKEGCLSFPNVFEQIDRFVSIKCAYQDLSGSSCEITVTGLAAHVVQHEIEHLDGILLIDKLHRIKRDRIKRKAQKKARTLRAVFRQQVSKQRKKKNSEVGKKELKIRKKRRLRSRG